VILSIFVLYFSFSVAALIAAQLDAQAEVAAAEQALKDAQLIAEAAALGLFLLFIIFFHF
jgi:hypothetical protein